MDAIAQLRTKTSMYFDLINFSELSEVWINEVIDNEFTEAEENDISLSLLFAHEAPNTLCKVADICLDWCEVGNESDVDPNTSTSEEVLWKVLDDMDINVRHIQSLIYLLCHRAIKKDASVQDMAVGLGCAKLYFTILRLPGSGAYSVYHPNLFNLCMDCLPAPDFISDKGSSVKDFEKLTVMYVPTLFSLIPVLRDFHLGDDSNTLEHAVKKLSEMAACEVQVVLKFNTDYLKMGEKEIRRRFRLSTVVSILAYEAFSAILSTDLNGDKDENYALILSHLHKYISFYRARKTTVNHKHIVVKDNAVAFICHNLVLHDFFSDVTKVALKRLCLGVVDKNEIRNQVSDAIITILLHMKVEAQTEMLEWFLLLIDSADTKDRVFALDILGQILTKTNEDSTNLLTESQKNDMLKVAIIFAILTRCDDVSPPVRTKALTILSHNIVCILKFLNKTKDQANFEFDQIDDIFDGDLDVNGNHRFFWYNLSSFRERLDEIEAILQRRIEDNNVNARKSALLALESLLVFDQIYVKEENLKHFDCATKDTNILVRRQVMQTLSVILDTYRDNADIQSVWIKCILPLVLDSESTVQAKALSVLEEQFLQKVFSSKQSDWESAFVLLKMISSDDFLAHQRYLQKAFSLWNSEKRLRSKSISQLEKYVGTEWEACVWFYISNFSMYEKIPSEIAKLVVDQFEKFDTSGEYPPFMKYLTKIISHIFINLSAEKTEIVCNVISNSLKSFSVPVELIPIYIDVLFKIYKHKSQSEEPKEFATFSASVIQKCEKHLKEITSAADIPEPPSQELLAKYFCSIKEFCQLCRFNITPSVISLLKTFSDSTQASKALRKILSPGLRAHAIAALGKISLQDEILAKDLLPVYAKELLTSNYDVIKNNVVVVLIEMCKRYTSFADKYVPLISLCFKDKLYLIRYQTIVLVVNLLQEGYIKWRGQLFFCLLSSLVDRKDAIQELGRYSLSQLLTDKKKNLFSEHFIDSIFVFNSFPPPDNETVATMVKELEQFALEGENKREERMLLYTFLLESMDLKERAYLINSIREILTSVAESVYPLNEKTECIIRDCFAILTCKEIRSFNIEQLENLDEAAESEIYKTELSTRKIVIIDPIIPAIVNLKNGLTDPESDLMHDIILFLKEFLHDFKDSLRDILAIDKILLRQLELEIKNDAEKERLEKRMEKDKGNNKPAPTEQAAPGPVTLQGIQSMVNEVSSMIVDQENEGGQKKDDALSQPTPKIPPQAKSARQLQKSSPKPGPSTSKAGEENSIQSTYNISSASPAEAAELERLASTPRVVLTALQVPLSNNILNISAIEKPDEPMNVDDTDEGVP